MMLHTNDPQPIYLPSNNLLHLTVIYPGKDFKDQDHYSKVIGQIKVIPRHCTPTAPTNVCIKFLHLTVSEI